MMNKIFHDFIDVFMVFYMEDLLIFSRTKEYHLRHIEEVLSLLKAEYLYVYPNKCSFTKKETEFLGMIVRREVIRVNPEKVEVVRDLPKPKYQTELRSFIGLLQFFRRFMKYFSAVASPLTALTKKNMGI